MNNANVTFSQLLLNLESLTPHSKSSSFQSSYIQIGYIILLI